MYVSNLTWCDGSLSSISVADPEGRSASFTVETNEAGPVLSHTPGVSETWRREACAYATVMLRTELDVECESASP